MVNYPGERPLSLLKPHIFSYKSNVFFLFKKVKTETNSKVAPAPLQPRDNCCKDNITSFCLFKVYISPRVRIMHCSLVSLAFLYIRG